MEITKHVVVILSIFTSSVQASEAGDCVRHLGSGGFRDYDCYETSAKKLETENEKTANTIKESEGLSSEDRKEVERYLRSQDEGVKGCGMAIQFSYSWKVDMPPKTHRNYYDVISARCHYTIRKQQNEFLNDLLSIKADQ